MLMSFQLQYLRVLLRALPFTACMHMPLHARNCCLPSCNCTFDKRK